MKIKREDEMGDQRVDMKPTVPQVASYNLQVTSYKLQVATNSSTIAIDLFFEPFS